MTTVPFIKTAFNIGDHGTYEDLVRVVTSSTAAAVNEMYNRKCQKMLDRFEDEHGDAYGFVEFPDVEGARADVLFYRRTVLELRDPQCYRVLEAGTRAGKHNMQKNLVGGRFQFLPVPTRMNLFAKHAIQTQAPRERELAAIHQSDREVGVLADRTAITMISGDYNAIPGSPSLRPYHGRYAFTQAADPTDTFGHRNIDGTMWHGPLAIPGVQVEFDFNSVLHVTKSDHLPISAHFQIKVKPW